VAGTTILSSPMHGRILCSSPLVVRFFVARFSLGLGCIIDGFRLQVSGLKNYSDEMTVLDQRGMLPFNKF
jgi:hypothetical protein